MKSRILVVMLVGIAWASYLQAQGPFEDLTADWMGTVRSGRVAGQPSVMFDREARKYRMWYFGGIENACNVWTPPGLHTTDRIYYTECDAAPNDAPLNNWTFPCQVIVPRGGADGFDAADDHLIGSPSVIRYQDRFYMYYEAYGKWVTLITSFYSADRSDTWVTALYPHLTRHWLTDEHGAESYVLDPVYNSGIGLGIALAFKKHGTHPIYAGEATFVDGKADRYLSCSPVTERVDEHGTTFRPMYDGLPIFWLFDTAGAGRKPLYACHDAPRRDSLASNEPGCMGHRQDEENGCSTHLLGYAIASLDAPDMQHANQNAICMAVWDARQGGEQDWVRLHGDDWGGSVATLSEVFTNQWPHSCRSDDGNLPCGAESAVRFDLHRAYGAGYPNAIVREGHLELSFADITQDGKEGCECYNVPHTSAVRIPLDRIADAAAYSAAERKRYDGNIYPGGQTEIRWSPRFARYFVYKTWIDRTQCGDPAPICGDECCPANDGYRESTTLKWSVQNPPWDNPSRWYSPVQELSTLFPTNIDNGTSGRYAALAGGSIAASELGHTLDYEDYTVFHIFYAAGVTGPGWNGSALGADTDHIMVVGYPQDAPDVPDIWVDFIYRGEERGTQDLPFNTLAEGTAAVRVGGVLAIKAGSTTEVGAVRKAMKIVASGGLVRIGAP